MDQASQIENLRGLTAAKPHLANAEEEELATSAQRRHLRESIQHKIFWTLWVQLAALFILMVFQGFAWGGFRLNDWAFGILSNGTILETFFIVRFIVVHLFPHQEQGKKTRPFRAPLASSREKKAAIKPIGGARAPAEIDVL